MRRLGNPGPTRPESPPSLERLRRKIERGPLLGLEAFAGIVTTYLAARHVDAWAAALVSGVWSILVARSWSRWADQLDRAIIHFSQLSGSDDLTGLCNDRHFREQMTFFAGPAARGIPLLSLVLIDLDQFKAYNDALGHPEGDVALKAVATILERIAIESDMAYRLGGDEFALLAPGLDEAEVLFLAEEIRAAIESYAWPSRHLTASLGVATVAIGTPDFADLRNRSDVALYRSKREGENRVCVFEAGDISNPTDGLGGRG